MLMPNEPTVAVIHLLVDHPSVLRQVIIRPDKLKGDLLRFGETPGDEANGWIRLGDIEIIAVLGRAIEPKGNETAWTCHPKDGST